jgi:transcriptional regulator with XRE-family HTH domain
MDEGPQDEKPPRAENETAAPKRSPKSRKRRAGPEDVEIGKKIRALRLERGMSQSELADAIGVTFQQVQKYEKGANRVSAGRLQKIADVLDVPITFFYDGTSSRPKKKGRAKTRLDLVQTKGAMSLLQSYANIASRRTKNALVVLAQSLSGKEKN